PFGLGVISGLHFSFWIKSVPTFKSLIQASCWLQSTTSDDYSVRYDVEHLNSMGEMVVNAICLALKKKMRWERGFAASYELESTGPSAEGISGPTFTTIFVL